MDNNMTLKELIKVQAMLLLLYIPSDFIVLIFFQGLNTWNKWKVEIVKIFMIMVILCFIALLSVRIKKLGTKKFFAYILGSECIIFSISILISLLNGYYIIYDKLNFGIIYAYIVVLLAAVFLLKKRLLKKTIKEKKETKLQDGWIYCVVAITLIITKRLSIDQKYMINIVISLFICFGWLIFGGFLAQLPNRDANEGTEI